MIDNSKKRRGLTGPAGLRRAPALVVGFAGRSMDFVGETADEPG